VESGKREVEELGLLEHGFGVTHSWQPPFVTTGGEDAIFVELKSHDEAAGQVDGASRRNPSVGVGDPVIHGVPVGGSCPAEDGFIKETAIDGGGLTIEEFGFVHVELAHIRIFSLPGVIVGLVRSPKQTGYE